jgi:16S rRNA (guanine527-N7)-methyltransferase
MMSETAERLRSRAKAHGLTVPPAVEAKLVAYFDLLARWNAKINLTALTDADAAVDRLLLEPLAAALALPRYPDLIDLGSGGGSPAIPLALALDARRLVMVESKGRKAAFLREASRSVQLNAVVENDRFESVAAQGIYAGQMDVVSIRAVRPDLSALTIAKALLKPGGKVALFSPKPASPPELPDELRVVHISPLLDSSFLVLLGR